MKSAVSLIVKIKTDQCKFVYESTSADYVEYMCCGKRETKEMETHLKFDIYVLLMSKQTVSSYSR